MGSPYVPLDSWVYGAFDRLAAMGYADTAFLGLRPWTRMECARLLDEMEEPTAAGALGGPQPALVQDLREEFKAEIGRWHGDSNIAADLESVYTRVGGIAGPALYDGYHLGQTITNDYGRPFRQGFDAMTGFTSHAVAGPFSFYFRGEYQHAPSVPNYPAAARQTLANIDSIFPVAPATQFPAEDRFDMVEGYAAVNIKGMQISFGKQSLWWGPGSGGALMFTNNAEPFYTVRVTRTIPMKLPSILGKLGPMQTDFILGRLGGHRSPVHPYIDGEKISFKPTPNLELGFSKISIFAGGSIPLNWHTFYKSTFSVGDHSTSDLPGLDPGDRRGSFDFRYRLPGLRRWVTLYSDSLVDDDPSPLAAPRRAAFNPGLYISHFPHMERLDFRAEAAYTDTPTSRSIEGRWIYWNFFYHDSHTNDGELMGHWVGREGKAVQVWSTYWLSAESKIQLGYRNGKVNGDFIPGGGTLNDVSGRADFKLRPNLLISGWLQYEQWKFPLIAPADKFQSNVAAFVQLTFTPHWTVKR